VAILEKSKGNNANSRERNKMKASSWVGRRQIGGKAGETERKTKDFRCKVTLDPGT